MLSLSELLDGDEWQAFVVRALYVRHRADLVEIPDQHKGDSGLEAFSCSDGCAYQCYAPEGLSRVADVAKKHKKKLSADISKFCNNRSALRALFGKTKIRRWILVVPDHCSADVVKFCQTKTAEVLRLAVPLEYVAPDFQIITVNGYLFLAKEISELTRVGDLQVEARNEPVQTADVQSFVEEHDEWIDNLDRKLSKLKLATKEHKKLRDSLLQYHLEGGNAIAFYDSKFPLVSDKVRTLKQAKARSLAVDSKLKRLTIAATREEFENELVGSIPALGRQTASIVSYASVTEWLMVCPLDPEG